MNVADFRNDKRRSSIWVVKTHLVKDVIDSLTEERTWIPAMFADEWHMYGRSVDSGRMKAIRMIVEKADFVVEMSGTLFPLGPSEDSEAVMNNLAGYWDHKRPFHDSITFTKWSQQQKSVLTKLYEPKGWSILRFRALISQFTLRRTDTSRWHGKLIIPNSIRRPMPIILAPSPGCAIELEANRQFDNAKFLNRHGEVNLGQYVKNSRHAQQRAWSSLFDEYEHLRTSGLGGVKAAERLIIEQLQYHPSARLEALARALYTLKKDGKRFIICAERLFLLRLAIQVLLLEIHAEDRFVVRWLKSRRMAPDSMLKQLRENRSSGRRVPWTPERRSSTN